MKKAASIGMGVICALLFLGACKKPENKTGFKTLSFQYKYGDEPLAFNKLYGTTSGDSVRLSTAKIYLSDVVLLKPNGSTQSLSTLLYFAHPETLSVSLKVPEGNYTGIRFNFGLTEGQNQFSSTTKPCSESPLCVDNDMWWDDVLKYTFVKLEGGVKLAGTNEFSSLVYHVGTAPYVRSITVHQSINITENGINNALVLDVQKILDGTNAMNMETERTTKTFDKPTVAGKFADNLVNAFSVE